MTTRLPTPPLLGRVLLRLSGLGERGADVHADMVELFHARISSLGLKAARRQFNEDAWSVWWRLPQRRTQWFTGLSQDFRLAARTVVRERTSSLVILITLAIGIAANAVMFGVVDQLLLRPPSGIAEADHVRVAHFGSDAPVSAQDGPGVSRVSSRYSHPVVNAVATAIGGERGARTSAIYAASVSLGDGPGARPATAELVGADYFSLLGVTPAAGRLSLEGPVVVLSHAAWMRDFNGARDAIGQDLRVQDIPMTIVGVAPRGFVGTGRRPIDAWVPLDALAPTILGARWRTNFGRFGFGLVARFPPELSPAETRALSTTALREVLAASDAPRIDPHATAFFVPLGGRHAPNGIGADAKVGLWLLGVAAMVLVIAIANVANILLTRALARRREIAVRLSLGVSQTRLLRQLLVESLVLSGGSAGIALVVAYAGGGLVQQLLLPGFAWDESVVDGRALSLTLAIVVITALAAGVAPATYARSVDLNAALRTAQPATSRRAGLLRSSLLVTQVSLCVVLLVGAGLFSKSLYAVSTLDVGADLDRLIDVQLPERARASLAQVEAAYAEAARVAGTIPGVARVSVVGGSTPMGEASVVAVRHEGVTEAFMAGRAMPFYSVVSAGYFATLGADIEKGRDLSNDDELARTRVAVINRALADERWPGADPIGQCITLGSDKACTRVIGVVENIVSIDRTDPHQPHVYGPRFHPFFAKTYPASMQVRVDGDADAIAAVLGRELRALAPTLPPPSVETMEHRAAPYLRPWRLGATMFVVFGAAALLIAVVGLSGAMIFAVSQRTHEIGVRVALGASRTQVVTQVGAFGMGRLGTGLIAGLLIAFLFSDQLVDLLFHTSPRDPWVYAGVVLALMVSGCFATIVPARRAASINPLIVLKGE